MNKNYELEVEPCALRRLEQVSYAVVVDVNAGYGPGQPVTLYDRQFRVVGRGFLGDWEHVLVDVARLQRIQLGWELLPQSNRK